MLSTSNILPAEILEQIFAYINASHRPVQRDLYACTLVSRSWYSNSIKFLYDTPNISGKNYDAFVRAMCPSVNAHVRTNGLAELVRRLDMSALVHNGSKSLTARVLGRVKWRLEEFVAPQASFAVNCLAALSKCTKLRRLDLSFVSESIPIADLLRSTRFLVNLTILYLPRSSSPDTRKAEIYAWPAKLQELHISGSLHTPFSLARHTFPQCLSDISINNCPHLEAGSLVKFLKSLAPQIIKLSILAPLPRVQYDSGLYDTLYTLPNLTHLRLSVDLIDCYFFLRDDDYNSPPNPLTRLDLHCFDLDSCAHVVPRLMYDCLGYGAFAKVRIIGVHSKLGWITGQHRRDLEEMNDLLKALAREDGKEARISESEAGVLNLKAF